MATLKFFLDTRAVKPESPAPLKIQLTHNRQVTFIALNIKLRPDQWDSVSLSVKNHPQKKHLNDSIRLKMSMAEVSLHDALCAGKRPDISAKELKAIIISAMTGVQISVEKDANHLFLTRFEMYRDSRTTNGTRAVYQQTINRMRDFDPMLPERKFEDIDKNWLSRFETFLAGTAKSANARAIHLRNIRAVFNDALDDEIISCYPFRKFKIRTQATIKRSLSVDELRTFMTYSCEEYQVIYRDMFILMFYLCGINAVDLLNARPDAITNGRLEYVRAKTHKPYSIKIEPEAMALLEKYRGKQYLLNIMDDRANYKDFLHRMDRALKQIGPVERSGLGGKKTRHPLFPDLSQYWCRHTWATIAAELDIPKETIAAGLGHGGNTVTDIYIRFDQKKVDVANRRVIDYVLYDRK